MATIIRIKRTETSGNPPSLGSGELAYSGLADNGSNGGDRLYIGMGIETNENAVNHVVIGGKYFTDAITAATSLPSLSTLVRRDALGNFASNQITVNDIIVEGILYSSSITASSVSVSGDAIITGNLTVQGTTTTVNSTAVAVSDINIVLAKDAVNAEEANGAGFTVAGPAVPPTLLYSSTNDSWNLNKELYVSKVHGDLVGNATTSSSLATARDLSITGDATWTTSFDGLANTTAALTLATVNATIGSFGNSTTIPTLTVNEKGLVTSVVTTSIPLATTSVFGLAAFDTKDFILDAGTVTLRPLDGGSY